MDGEGILEVEGIQYKGVWKDGLKHGKFEVLLNGKLFETMYYYEGIKCIEHTKKGPASKIEYTCFMTSDEKIHGRGTVRFKAFPGKGVKPYQKYEGEFFEGLFDGYGELIRYKKKKSKEGRQLGKQGKQNVLTTSHIFANLLD
jgi:hypothetical protein